MKVILHGATNGSNFGDFLFAAMFYRKLEDINPNQNIFYEFPMFGIGKFYRKYLNYNYKQKKEDIRNADILVYFSGGYFGEKTNYFKEAIIRYIRYFHIGKYFLKNKKKIAIIGIGGGPISNKLLRKTICNIMEKAEIVIVRDKKTYNYFKEYGVSREIKISTDTVLALDKSMIPKLDTERKNELDRYANYKKIFLHLEENDKIYNKMKLYIIPAINRFLKKHQDYVVILGYDGIPKNNKKYLEIYNKLDTNNKLYFKYQDPWQLCSTLNEMDLIITCKLHVGIVSYILEKSILSFPVHSEKTTRFYESIGEAERCIPIDKLNENDVYNLLEKYYLKKIKVDKQLVNKAKENLEELGNLIKRSN